MSPLARNFGVSQLSPEEQTKIHEAIAAEMLRGSKISASDADTIFAHAIIAKSSDCLMKLALGVVSANAKILPLLSDNLTFLQIIRTDRAILPEFSVVSIMLRLAQFKLRAAAGNNEEAATVAAALLRELQAYQDEGELNKLSRVLVLATILSTMGVADYLDNWPGLLRQFKELVDSGRPDVRAAFYRTLGGLQINAFGALFWIGASRISTVGRLENVIQDLGNLNTAERAQWLAQDRAVSDYMLFINRPWATEQRSEDFDANDAAVRYSRMAEKTKDWGIESLTIECWIAKGVMLDEYIGESEAALTVLDEAISVFGERVRLLRAKAKVYWRREDHRRALSILRSIADQIGDGTAVERAFALRDAAISAAKCNEWGLAARWFWEARGAASSCQTDDMHVMTIGLGADAAVAALMDGDARSALQRFADALDGLSSVDPEASLSAAYGHRVIRHAVLWAMNKIAKTDMRTSDVAISIEPGCCSNPEPSSSISELPLAPLDTAWYLLAEAEIHAEISDGIADSLSSRISDGEIPIMECRLRALRIKNAIKSSDTAAFVRNLGGCLDALAFLARERERLGKKFDFDPTNPPRGKIPRCDSTSALAEATAADHILAFGMCAALAGRNGKLNEVQNSLGRTFGKAYPGNTLFEVDTPNKLQLNRIVLGMLQRLDKPEHIEPRTLFLIGLRFFEYSGQSGFRVEIDPLLARWSREAWFRIVRDEAFRLTYPTQTVPRINAVLVSADNDRPFLAALLFAASDAVGSPLSADYSKALREIATAGMTRSHG
jgi:hypothetical protein